MGDYSTIRAVSLTLKALLESHITASSDTELKGVPIDLRSPRELHDVQAISLWLYRVMRNGDLYNRPPERRFPDQVPQRPLPLDLYYLVTPLRKDPQSEQTLLGRVMQVFNDHPVLSGGDFQDSLKGQSGEIRLTLEMLSLEESTRIWTALAEPYELSVSYHVQAIQIESDHPPVQTSPVIVRETRYKQIVGVE
jgi:hypothetical protein